MLFCSWFILKYYFFRSNRWDDPFSYLKKSSKLQHIHMNIYIQPFRWVYMYPWFRKSNILTPIHQDQSSVGIFCEIVWQNRHSQGFVSFIYSCFWPLQNLLDLKRKYSSLYIIINQYLYLINIISHTIMINILFLNLGL